MRLVWRDVGALGDDCFVIWRWREGKDDYDNHCKWFMSRAAAGLFWIVHDLYLGAVGYIRVDQGIDHPIVGDDWFVSYLVSPEYRGQGYGQAMIDQLPDRWPEHTSKRVVAYVDADNVASNKIFERAGWKLASDGDIRTYVLEAPDADTCTDHGDSPHGGGDGTPDDSGGEPSGGPSDGGPE